MTKERRSEIEKKYKDKNRIKIKLWSNQYYKKNRDKILARNRAHYKNNVEQSRIKGERYMSRCVKSWAEYIPESTRCQVCGKIIFFKNHPRKETIHFDHKHDTCAIKITPATWMLRKVRTEANQKIWDSCDFGMLCLDCNKRLPTKNRKEWLEKVIAYVNK